MAQWATSGDRTNVSFRGWLWIDDKQEADPLLDQVTHLVSELHQSLGLDSPPDDGFLLSFWLLLLMLN